MSKVGHGLRRLAVRLYADDTLRHVIDPILADLQHEHHAALAAGSAWRARGVRFRGYAAFWSAVAVQSVYALADSLRTEHRAVSRHLGTVGLIGLALTVFFTAANLWIDGIAFTEGFARLSAVQQVRAVVMLLPSSLAAALPAGFLLGGLLTGGEARRRSVVGWRIMTAVVGMMASAMLVGVVVPEANQQFRVLVFKESGLYDREPSRGAMELSWTQLRRDRETAAIRAIPVEQVRMLAFAYHVRVALTLAPLLFGVLTLAKPFVSLSPARVQLSTWVTALLYLAYYAWPDFPRMVEQGAVSPLAVAWGPVIGFTSLTIGSVGVRRMRSASAPPT